MDIQELFNKMWAGFEAQNWEPSIAADGVGCFYLNDEGRKCAVGHLLPDNHPGQSLLAPVDRLVGKYPDLIETIGWKEHYFFLRDAQAAHDLAATSCRPLKPAFEELAESYALTIPGAQ